MGTYLRDTTLEEWKENPKIMNWVKIQPSLAGEDLRPYIFITRDRQQSIFGYAAGGRLALLIDRLCGDEYSISAATGDVKALDQKDSLDVAQSLKSTALATGEFNKTPRGFEGLMCLVTHKPEMGRVALGFLQGISAGELGGWAWPSLKTLAENPELKADATALEQRWTREGSKSLKQAMASFSR
jgi:hypothetical protein